MTLLDILQGLGSLLVLALGVTVLYTLAKGSWLLLVRSLQATSRFAGDVIRNPRQAVVDAPFLIQLLILPFLMAWERVEKWRHPEEVRRKNAIFKKVDTAAKVFQSRLGQVALYREGRTITLCKIVDFEVDAHLVSFEAEPVAHPGFSEGVEPWHFRCNWDYFFYDAECWVMDSQFMRWRVNFDDERIEQLKACALTLPADLEAGERYGKLNHFFTFGEAGQDPVAVAQALEGLKAYVHAQPGAAWLQTLPQALQADLNIMSMYAFPGHPDSDTEIKFEERRGDCVMWVPMHPNPWRIQFSHGNLLRWWEGRNA